MAADETINGTNRSDYLKGGSGDDRLEGYGGSDMLFGRDGNDRLYGGNEHDSLYGGAGNDTLEGGNGRDMLAGGSGDDSLVGGNDQDRLYGGTGHDTLLGNDGDDDLYGYSGDDLIDAGRGNDLVYGGEGQDTLQGGEGVDTIHGYSGDDSIDGGSARDFLFGYSGNDTIDGGDGEDLIYGDSGDDDLTGGQGQDTIYGGSGNDVIRDGEGNNKGTDLFYGGSGHDTLYSSGNQDSLYGGTGSDTFVIRAEDGHNFNNVTVDGGWHLHGDQNSLDLSQIYSEYPNVQLIYEQGSPETTWGRILVKSNGRELGRINYANIDRVIICFTPGTLIATVRGEVPVEELRPDDRVITRDNGMQDLRWIGSRRLSQNELMLAPQLRPVRIRAGAFGRGLPSRDLVVSPSHRMLIRSDRASLLYEESEVLIAAKHLVGVPGVERVDDTSVTYMHLLFDQHEVILANGVWTESFQPGDYSMKGLGDDQRNEIFYLFPELKSAGALDTYGAARRSLKKHEVKVLRASGDFLNY